MSEPQTMVSIGGGAPPAPVVDADEDIQTQDDDLDLESGEEGDHPPDASEDEPDAVGDDDPNPKSAKTKDGDEDSSSLQAKLDDSEKKRAEWQSKADASESDLTRSTEALTKAMDIIRDQTAPSGNGDADTSGVTFKSLGIDEDSLLDKEPLQKILNHMNGQRAVDNQAASNNNLLAQINAATEKHPDMQEIAEHWQSKKMDNRKEAPLLHNLGRYYMAKSDKLEAENKQLRLDHKAELVKQSKTIEARKKRNAAIPPHMSGRGTMRDPVGELGETAEYLQRRRKERSM